MARKPVRRLHPDPPLVPPEFDPVSGPLGSGTLWDCVEAASDAVIDEHAADARVQESRLVGVDLTGRRLSGLRCRDTRFERCDLSGAVLDGASLQRVEFVGCRLTGTVFRDGTLTDVRIADCAADLITLRTLTATTVVIEDSTMRGAHLQEFEARDCALLGCDLTEVEFTECRLAGTRLHRSEIVDVRGALALQGCRIGADQVVPVGAALVAAFGIEVAAETDACGR